MGESATTKALDHREEREALLHLLEIYSAASPAGAAAAHLASAEREILATMPREVRGHKPAVFLLQAVPLVPVFNDLRQIEKGLQEWMTSREDRSFSGCGLPTRTPGGLEVEDRDRWRIEIHPNGYVGFAAFSRPLRNEQAKPAFGLGHELSPLSGVADLCVFVGEGVGLPPDATWRLRCTVLNGPAQLMVTDTGGGRRRGFLPSNLVDKSMVATNSIVELLAVLLRLLDKLSWQDDYY